jgi:hypothetical protein
MGNVLEFASSLLADLSSDQEADDEPFEDFGDEPTSKDDAIKRVTGFIERCCSILTTNASVRPYMSMSVRAATFYCELCLSGENQRSKG